MISKILIVAIVLYQKTISPDHGFLRPLFPNGYCQYYPSCSQYAKESLMQRGWRGVIPALWRVLRCNPWSSGGLDPIQK